MGDRAADGAATADLEVADVRRRQCQQRHRVADLGALLHVALAHHRADNQLAVRSFDAPERFDATHVDQGFEAREAHVEQRDQALAPGEDLGLVAQLGEQAADLVHRFRRVVGKRRWLHPRLPEPVITG